MAQNMTGMLVEETVVIGTGTKHAQGRRQRLGAVGAVAATLALLLISSVTLHHHSFSSSAVPANLGAVTSQQTRFIENNTTNLPNAITAESAPAVVTSSEQRFLEANTTTLPDAVMANEPAPIMTQAQQRFWEVNTMLLPEGPLYPTTEDVTPLPGHPR